MGLKEDAKFARFITMGALGAERIANDLTERGHRIIELERYAMANKIWSTKVKRLRMADLLCLQCGRRFEAKAKSKLEVKISDSQQAGRGWRDGMRPEDVFAFIPVVVDGNNRALAIGIPLYLTMASMDKVTPKKGQLKSATDGSERDIYWPITVATRAGVVSRVQAGRITIQPSSGKASTLGRSTDSPLVKLGDRVDAGSILGASVSPATDLACAGITWSLTDAMNSDDQIEVFAAVKAAGVLKADYLITALSKIATADDRDTRLRIEALGALARLGDATATSQLAGWSPDDRDVAMQMERVLVLSELIDNRSATRCLLEIAHDQRRSEEIRAAAVWGLGATWHNQFTYCWEFVSDEIEKVRRHAQAGLGRPTSSDLPGLILALADRQRAPLAAAMLARSRGAISQLIAALSDEDRHDWALQALGQIDPGAVNESADVLKSCDRAALNALWCRNIEDSYNEPTNLTEIRFLTGQSLRAPNGMGKLPPATV